MRHPKNPFSSDEPGDDASEWQRDDQELAAEAAPGRGSGTPPSLPRRTGDSGFRPHDRQAPPSQDFWPMTDPEDAWPLAPRPQATGSWTPAGPEDDWPAGGAAQGYPRDDRAHADPPGAWETDPPGAWETPAPRQGDPRGEWAHADLADEWVQAGPGEPWTARAPQQADPRDEWLDDDPQDSWQAPAPAPASQQADPRHDWAHGDPQDSWQAPVTPQADPRDDWGQAGPEESWEHSGPVQGGPPGSWGRAAARDSWSPGSRPQAAPRDPWLPPPAEGDHAAPGPTGPGDLPSGGDGFFPAPPRSTGRAQEDDRPQHDDLAQFDNRPQYDERHGEGVPTWEDEDLRPDAGPWEDDRPRQERLPAAGQAPVQEADPAAASMGPQDLWESWEPPYDPGAVSEPVLHPTAPYPELVRDAEYEDELGLWETPSPGGPGRGGPHGGGPHGGSPGGEPSYPGPRRRAQHARNAGRPRMSGAFLALAGALAVAGAIPLGILGVRTLGHHGNTALKTAPLSANHAAPSARGANGAATFTALAGPGCPAAAGAGAFPYHAPNGDGWHNATGTGAGPCGSSFIYSYLAMVPGNPGEWHDHYAWIFRTGMNNPSCTFSLYIPAAPQANATDYYWFSAGDSNANNRIADFTIDQATHQGQWITKGPFTFPGGTVLIEATDRGEGAPTASVAAGPARLRC
jgi:hypothetical protein